MRILPILTAASLALFAVANTANAQMNNGTQDTMGNQGSMGKQDNMGHGMSNHMGSSKMHKNMSKKHTMMKNNNM